MSTTPDDMRTWGLVSEAELERIVVVSPHLDDAVLGCAQLLSAHPGATVVTVFTGRPEAYPAPMTHWDTLCGFGPGDEVLDARKDEDRAALAQLGAVPRWLDLVEHQYLERPEWVGPDAVAEPLREALVELDPTLVLVPFGLANPDHATTHDAAMSVREALEETADESGAPARAGAGRAWLCYEDSGYKHIPGMLAWRVAQLFRRGLWPTPVAVPIDAGQERKRAALARYSSQLRALEADWNIAPKLDAPAPEQYWRLAPPPLGWEVLSADS